MTFELPAQLLFFCAQVIHIFQMDLAKVVSMFAPFIQGTWSHPPHCVFVLSQGKLLQTLSLPPLSLSCAYPLPQLLFALPWQQGARFVPAAGHATPAAEGLTPEQGGLGTEHTTKKITTKSKRREDEKVRCTISLALLV